MKESQVSRRCLSESWWANPRLCRSRDAAGWANHVMAQTQIRIPDMVSNGESSTSAPRVRLPAMRFAYKPAIILYTLYLFPSSSPLTLALFSQFTNIFHHDSLRQPPPGSHAGYVHTHASHYPRFRLLTHRRTLPRLIYRHSRPRTPVCKFHQGARAGPRRAVATQH